MSLHSSSSGAGDLRRQQRLHGAALPFAGHHQRGQYGADHGHDDGDRPGDNKVLANSRRVKPVAHLHVDQRFKGFAAVFRPLLLPDLPNTFPQP